MSVWRPPERFARFKVPASLLSDTFSYLNDGEELESIAYWAGKVDGPDALVTRLVEPRAIRDERFVIVPVEEVSRVVNECAEVGDFLVAQIHTHPQDEDHSKTDDCGTVSKRNGFVSLVVPFYGRYSSLTKPFWFGYELMNGEWREFEMSRVHVLY